MSDGHMFVVGPLGFSWHIPPKIVELVESVDPRWTFQTRRAEFVGPDSPGFQSSPRPLGFWHRRCCSCVKAVKKGSESLVTA
mmetsp:Transcript_8350/g.23234  ORF Transcript_8350/g.23234 Transcript_8350/m.23234 type:complete len:82 (-) Transcript_8350:151-396(-)